MLEFYPTHPNLHFFCQCISADEIDVIGIKRNLKRTKKHNTNFKHISIHFHKYSGLYIYINNQCIGDCFRQERCRECRCTVAKRKSVTSITAGPWATPLLQTIRNNEENLKGIYVFFDHITFVVVSGWMAGSSHSINFLLILSQPWVKCVAEQESAAEEKTM